MSNKSILCWAGGKGELASRILPYFPQNYDIYCELFFGGGSLLFQKEPNGVEVINDLNENVYSLFKVLSDKELFQQFKEKCDITFYSRQINQEFIEDLTSKNLSLVDRAYKFFIVNRTSFNGNNKGFSSKSTTIRRNMANTVSRFLTAIDGLEWFHQRLQRCIVENKDGLKLIEEWDRPKVFQYLDVPYVLDTRSPDLYLHEMSNDDHKRFINICLNIKNAKLLISGYDHEIYNPLIENGWNKIEIETSVRIKSGQEKTSKIKKEILWKNY